MLRSMLRGFLRHGLALLLGAILFGGICAHAQTGRITGTVRDKDGLPVAGAKVQVINLDTKATKETQADESGVFAVPFLPGGNYQIVIDAAGFAPSTSPTIALGEAQALVSDASLNTKGETTNVTVDAGNDNAVELGNASISTTLSETEVKAYGLNGRNFSQLLTIAPGVSNQSGQDEAKVGVAGSAKFSVNGGRVEYNTFEVDGSDVLNTSINASRGQGEPLMVYPSIDAIEDIKVLTSNYSAVYGKSASGSVLITTKSGTDKLHGSIYEFLRNEIFNARNYFDQPQTVPLGYVGKLKYKTPLYRRQDFGGTIGGPFFIPHLYDRAKSKTFFFFSEEVRIEKTPVDYNQAVPTIAERSGNFSDVCPVQQPGVPYTLNTAKYPDCPRSSTTPTQPGTAVTGSYTAQAILNTGLIPLPNSVNGCNTTNSTAFYRCYVASISPPTHFREELFRIDHNLTPGEILSFRYIHDSWDTVTLTPQWGIVKNSFPTVENKLNGPGLDMVLSLTQSLPHGFLNRATAAYAVQHITLEPQAGPGVTSLSRPGLLDAPCSSVMGPVPVRGTQQTLAECPIGYIFANGFGGNKTPGLVFQGTNGAYGGHGFAVDTGYAPWNQSNPTYLLRDDFSKVIGKHSLQFGAQGTYVQQNELSAVTGANSGDLQGLLTFSNQQSRFSTGNAFADFYSGQGIQPINPQTGTLLAGVTQTAIKSFTQDSGQGRYYTRYKLGEFYLQDDWQIRPRLSVNVGFRGSLFGPWVNAKNTAYNWRPEAFDQALGGQTQVDGNYGYLVNKQTGSPFR